MATEYRFYSALRLAVRLVKKWFPEYALIGRFARNFYAPPETTLDADFLVNLDDHEKLKKILEYASARFQVSPMDIGHWKYKLYIKSFRFDLVKPKGYNYDPEVVARRRHVKLGPINEVAILSPRGPSRTLPSLVPRQRSKRPCKGKRHSRILKGEGRL
ncbi:hypothetical protein TCARB_0918 [Thermofilum adornatum 1505]|uniref:Polymerase nucleotidyl transferase domain-containing protein n=1 Tax=Thermofilum adornatum 1505 TaxID=697581 RepID=A0A3G1A720_9CREN|nr:hypothetical protein [Thermofilum adornatum]AJB41968.1 hypothetical protein TCARB_0918 [Thermofilum adornatum 1505]